MHGRAPAVERLYFHLENQQPVYWKDSQEIGTVLAKSTIKESMFTAWMNSNKIYHHGRDLTYAEYVSKFVYDARKRCLATCDCMKLWVLPPSMSIVTGWWLMDP